MKIAIHYEGGFTENWIRYCKKNSIAYKVVDCYNSNIICDLKGCDALMWHFHQSKYKDSLFSKQLLFALQARGMSVFPDFNTCWHFDDKVGQKYLFESLNLPFIESHVFYEKQPAMKWIDTTTFPIIFKLRGGAGSSNVHLIHSKKEASKIIRKAFTNGFKQFNGWNYFLNVFKKYQKNIVGFKAVIKGFGRIFLSTDFSKRKGREKGYVYFQKFIPANHYDIRIIVIDGKAFGIKRMVRKNDFRASGSGEILYGKKHFDPATILLAFETANKLKAQCCALDFIYDENKKPLIIEVSYGFKREVYEPCPGYWDRNLNFHEGKINPCDWMVETVLRG